MSPTGRLCGDNLWSREAPNSIELLKLKTMPLLCPKDEIMKYKANFYYRIDDHLLLGVPLLRTTGVAGIRCTKQSRRILSFLEKSLIKEE